jgi:hypothetical protein
MSKKTIIMQEEDKQRWDGVLKEYYRNKEVAECNIRETIDQIYAECQLGWERAPRDLDTRIKMKSGFQWKSHENLKPNKNKNNFIAEDEEDLYNGSISDTMTKKEKEWWEDRESTYRKDFDFNESSDKPLMEQMLVEELIQRRLFRKQLRYPDRDYSKQMSDSLKRVTEIQTKLGITREQRVGILDKIDGNVALISSELDKKLDSMPENIKKEYEKEVYYQSLKDQRPPINILPSITKVEALLNVKGKTTINLDSSQISKITEEVTKEISEVKKAPPPKKELPDGVNVSR